MNNVFIQFEFITGRPYIDGRRYIIYVCFRDTRPVLGQKDVYNRILIRRPFPGLCPFPVNEINHPFTKKLCLPVVAYLTPPADIIFGMKKSTHTNPIHFTIIPTHHGTVNILFCIFMSNIWMSCHKQLIQNQNSLLVKRKNISPGLGRGKISLYLLQEK